MFQPLSMIIDNSEGDKKGFLTLRVPEFPPISDVSRQFQESNRAPLQSGVSESTCRGRAERGDAHRGCQTRIKTSFKVLTNDAQQ